MKFLTVYNINLLFSTLCLILIFSSPQPTLQAVITSYGLQDLETNNNYYFISDTNLWTHSSLSPSNPNSYTFCSQRYILGGKGALANSFTNGAYFTKTYTDLPDHAYIKFTIHLWIMQGWPSTDKLVISFDGVPYAGFNTGLGSVPDTLTMQSYTTDQCGGTWLADVGLFRLYGGFTHTDSSITLTISGNIAQDSYTVAFGFRNVTMQFAAAAPTSLPSRCLLASSTVVPGGSTPYVAYSPYTCACPEGMYYDSTSGCLTCHMSCLSCYASSAKGCWRCQEGYQFDGTSCVSCGSSCTVCSGTGGLYDSQNVCRECTSMTFAYLLPSEMGHYYMLNLAPGTCNLDETAVAKYLNANSIDSDVFPSFSFVITPLLDNTYLVEIKLEKSLVYTTDLNITMQYLQATVSVPRKFIESDTLQSLHNVFKVGKIILIVIIILSIFGTTALGTPEALWSFVNLLQFMSFLRFLNIPYPKLVEQFLAMGQAADWSMVPNLLGLVSIPESDNYLDTRLLTAESDFYQNSLPAGEYIHTSDASYFLYNAGAIIIGTPIVLLFVLIVLATGNGSRDGSSLLMRSFRDTIRWNFTIRFYLITGIPLALWICLQLRYFGFDNNYQSACSVLTLLFSLYFVVMLVSVVRILKNQESESKSRFKRLFGTLTVGMATDKHGGKYYHFFIFLRGILIALLIGFVETIPFLQISLLIYCNVGIVYYLFQQAVFVDTKLQTINKVKELLVLFSEIWLLCINVQVDSTSYYNVMEWLVISTLGPASALELFYLVGLQLIGAGTIFAKVKKFGQYCQVCFKTARNPPTRLQGGRRTRNEGNINDETDIGG